MSLLIIQHVHSAWTKASRGGEGARLRNAVPDAVRLPEPDGDSRYFYHHAQFYEKNRFEQSDVAKMATGAKALNLRVLQFDEQENSVGVRIYRDGYNAAGQFWHPFYDVFTLRESEWGRIVYNGRYTDDDSGNWWYEKSVFNIGLMSEMVRDVFVTSEPDFVFSKLAHLR